jgi:hypothetical protein
MGNYCSVSWLIVSGSLITSHCVQFFWWTLPRVWRNKNGPYLKLREYEDEEMYLYVAYGGLNISDATSFSYVRVKDFSQLPIIDDIFWDEMTDSDVILLNLLTPVSAQSFIKISNGADGKGPYQHFSFF